MKADEKYNLIRGYKKNYHCEPDGFESAPGRVELLGNHTDHQHGKVLAAAVDLTTRGAFRPNQSDTINVVSKGFRPFSVSINDTEAHPEEKGTSAALVRGLLSAFSKGFHGHEPHRPFGFDLYAESDILPGSGFSSSAAFEILCGKIMNRLFASDSYSPVEIAMMGQYAENIYFGKPCGLMDQMASSVGDVIYIDFKNPENPEIQKISFDFAGAGYVLCAIDSGSDHAGLTAEYAAIPLHMKETAEFLGVSFLRDTTLEKLMENEKAIRTNLSDLHFERSVHCFMENSRVTEAVNGLSEGYPDAFFKAIKESGDSSIHTLKNVIPVSNPEKTELYDAMMLAGKILKDLGAEPFVRLNGGGFAGTALAFAPASSAEQFKARIDEVLGNGRCRILNI